MHSAHGPPAGGQCIAAVCTPHVPGSACQQPGSLTMCMLPRLRCSYCNSPWTGKYCETKA